MRFGNLGGLLKPCRLARRMRVGGLGLRCGSIRRLSGCGLRLLLRGGWMLVQWLGGSLTRLRGLRMQCIRSAFALLKWLLLFEVFLPARRLFVSVLGGVAFPCSGFRAFP